MKLIAIVLASLSLTACGYIDREVSGYTGKPSEVCISGVSYLQFTSGATVKFTPEGKPVTCKE